MKCIQGKQKDSTIYYHDGHVYYLDNRASPILRCKFKKNFCPAAIYLTSIRNVERQEIQVFGEHIEASDYLFSLRHQFTEEVEILARTTFDDLKTLYDRVKSKEE